MSEIEKLTNCSPAFVVNRFANSAGIFIYVISICKQTRRWACQHQKNFPLSTKGMSTPRKCLSPRVCQHIENFSPV